MKGTSPEWKYFLPERELSLTYSNVFQALILKIPLHASVITKIIEDIYTQCRIIINYDYFLHHLFIYFINSLFTKIVLGIYISLFQRTIKPYICHRYLSYTQETES